MLLRTYATVSRSVTSVEVKCQQCGRMKGHWWSFWLGLLCMHSEATLQIHTASQNPSSISYVSVNSSTEITCSTTLADPLGLDLCGFFHNTIVVNLALKEGQIFKNTTAKEFVGRIRVNPARQTKEGHSFTLQLSLLGLKDTDLYYCKWTYFTIYSSKKLSSNGTVIIVGETDNQTQCKDYLLDLTLIALSITAFVIIVFLSIAALVQRRKRFKKNFRPARPLPDPPRPSRPHRVHPQHQPLHTPYSVRPASTVYIE